MTELQPNAMVSPADFDGGASLLGYGIPLRPPVGFMLFPDPDWLANPPPPRPGPGQIPRIAGTYARPRIPGEGPYGI